MHLAVLGPGDKRECQTSSVAVKTAPWPNASWFAAGMLNPEMHELLLKLTEREQDLTEKVEIVSFELWCSALRSEGSETGLIGVGSEGFAETDLAKCCPGNQSDVFYVEPLLLGGRIHERAGEAHYRVTVIVNLSRYSRRPG